MSQRLTDDDAQLPLTQQVRWLCVNGQHGWYSVWSDGVTLPIITGADGAGDDDDTGGAGDDDDDDSDSDDDDDDDDGDDDKSSKSKSASASEKAKLSQEAKKYRLQRNAEKERAAKLEAELKTIKDAGLKDDEKKDARIKELEEQIKGYEPKESRLRHLEMFVALINTAAESKVTFEDPEEALLLINNKSKYRDLIEVDDDGEISGMDEAVKALAKDKPRMLIKATGTDESDDDDDDAGSSGNGAGGAKRSASKSFGGKKKGTGIDRAALEAKFPALRR